VSNPLSKKRWSQFVSQARGANVLEIRIKRQDKRNAVVLRYSGQVPKKKSRVNGEWSISRGGREAEALDADVLAFLNQAREHFFVHRGEGLEDEKYADGAMEAKGTPIKGETA